MNNIKDFFGKYYDGVNQTFGTVRLVMDIVLVSVIAFLIIRFILKFTNKPTLIFSIFGFAFLYIAASLLDLIILKQILIWCTVTYILMLLIVFTPDLKPLFGDFVKVKKSSNYITNEKVKEQLINVLIKVSSELSKRNIGAIITIEKDNLLNLYIDKAIALNADASYELFETIFTPGTALHDGAVIIRGNKLMCGSALFPIGDNADIPSHFGSRHRAAIGISSVSDALTIVLSEETGSISYTIDGTISYDITVEELKSTLDKNIRVKSN